MIPRVLSRRAVLRGAAAGAMGLLVPRWLQAQTLRPLPEGRLIGPLPLGRFDGRPAPPLGTLLGTGLDARQFTDLSALDPAQPLIPTERFYVRTAHAPGLPSPETWTLTCGGLVAREEVVTVGALAREASAMGTHLLECSGNADPANFGLLSAASWDGVRVSAILGRLRPQAAARRIQITGFDDENRRSISSMPGASWVFSPDELDRQGAFFAVGMNGALLTPDHGAPVRLVVPNYYGCSSIKWVTRLDWLPEVAPTTGQMREFAARTHQTAIPELARDYEPPVIDLAAMPIRVEQWELGSGDSRRLVYRVIGLRWGGTRADVPLTIRFSHREPFVPVDDQPASNNPTSWSFWSHVWRPAEPGRYQIALSVADKTIRTRRLDLFYYTREVETAGDHR